MWQDEYFPVMTHEIRRSVWRQIQEAGDEMTSKGIPSRLNEAWDQTKRSREYLNANMEKDDLDNIYYNHAYRK